MTDKYKVGQRVRIIKGRCSGREASILQPRRQHPNWHNRETDEVLPAFVYAIDVEGEGSTRMTKIGVEIYAVPEDWLAPIYDGYEKTTWDDCYKVTGWTPKILEKV